MTPLTDDEAGRISLIRPDGGKEAPPLDPGGSFTSFIYLKNDSPVTLDSQGEAPLFLSYHLRDEAGTTLVHDGPRTPLPEPLRPGQTLLCPVNTPLPREDGKYVLRLTLVQEQVMWLDNVAGLYIDVPVEVKSRKWWTEEQAESLVFGSVKFLNQGRYQKFFEFAGRCRPLMLHVETVNICNLRCLICPCRRMTRKKQWMPMPLFEKLIDDYCDLGGGDVALTPQIGDVFLDRHLSERLALLKERAAIKDLGFVTNAVAVDRYGDRELAGIMKAVRRLHVSIYGLEAAEHALMTGTDVNLYERVLNNIERLIELRGDTIIGLGFRGLRERSTEEIKEWIFRRFKTELPFAHITQYGNWAGAMDTSRPLPGEAGWLPITGPRDNLCKYPVLHSKVLVDGSVKFCSCIDYDNMPENTIGHLATATLADIYNGESARKLWRNGFSKCDGCTHYESLDIIGEYFSYLDNPIRRLGV